MGAGSAFPRGLVVFGHTFLRATRFFDSAFVVAPWRETFNHHGWPSRVNRLWPLVLTQPVRCPAGVPVRFPPTNMTSENALAAPALPPIPAVSAIRWGGLCVSRHNR